MVLTDGRSRFRAVAWVGFTGVLILAAIGVAVLLRAAGPPPGTLELVALGSDGRFGSDIELAPAADGTDGYPFVLAVTNQGRQPRQPRSLALTMPSWLRLVDTTGAELAYERSAAEPLVRFRLEFPDESVEPDAFPQVLAGLDQVRLELVVNAIDCRLSWDGVPEFGPAPPWDRERLAASVIFWSLGIDGGRESGVLRVHLPAGSFPRGLDDVAFGEPTRHTDGAPRPVVDSLSQEYSMQATCGEPERPLDLLAVAWRSATGALMIDVQHAGQSRIQLFDIDNDGRIDLEIKDTDADGVFETRRPVSYAIPVFLTPHHRTMEAGR